MTAKGATVVSGTAFSITENDHRPNGSRLTGYADSAMLTKLRATRVTVLKQQILSNSERLQTLDQVERVALSTQRYIDFTINSFLQQKISQRLSSLHDQAQDTQDAADLIQQAQWTQDSAAEKRFLALIKAIPVIQNCSFRDAKVQEKIQRHNDNLTTLIHNLENPEMFKGKTDYKTLIGLAETVYTTICGLKDGRRNEPGIIAVVREERAILSEQNATTTALLDRINLLNQP